MRPGLLGPCGTGGAGGGSTEAPRWLGELRVGAKRGLRLDLGMAEPEKRLCELLEQETLRPCLK